MSVLYRAHNTLSDICYLIYSTAHAQIICIATHFLTSAKSVEYVIAHGNKSVDYVQLEAAKVWNMPLFIPTLFNQSDSLQMTSCGIRVVTVIQLPDL